MASLTTAPAPAPYGAAYLIHPDAVGSVRSLLQASGLRITPTHASDAQVPRYNITLDGKSARRDESLSNLLTEREMETLHGMSRGMTNKDIGAWLFLSEDTIKTHSRRVFRKLGARDRAQAVAIGYQRGILGGA